MCPHVVGKPDVKTKNLTEFELIDSLLWCLTQYGVGGAAGAGTRHKKGRGYVSKVGP